MKNPIPCIIVDDNSSAISTITAYASEMPQLDLKKSYTKPIIAMGELSGEKIPHLIYMDIDMPGMSGIELANSLRDLPHHVIFTTSYPDFAIEAFDLRARHYLLKPFNLSEFARKTEVVIREFFDTLELDNETEDAFLLRKEIDSKRLIKVPKADIIYIQGANNHIHFYTTGGDYSVYMTFSEIRERLSGHPKFYHVQRSYIINTDQLDEIEGNTIYLKGYQVIMSPLYNAPFMKWVNGIWLKTRRR